jgi:hypothetical protein
LTNTKTVYGLLGILILCILLGRYSCDARAAQHARLDKINYEVNRDFQASYRRLDGKPIILHFHGDSISVKAPIAKDDLDADMRFRCAHGDTSSCDPSKAGIIISGAGKVIR